MNHDNAPLLERLDRLAETLETCFSALETRLRDLEKETGEIRALVTALKDNLDSAVDELIEEDEEGEAAAERGKGWRPIH